MKRKNLYKRILTKILTVYSGLAAASPEYQDVEDHIDNENMDDAASSLLVAPNLKKTFKPLLLTIQDVYNNANKEDNLSSEYTTIELFRNIEDKYKRSFFYRGQGLTVIMSEYIFPSDTDQRYDDSLWMSLQSILLDNHKFGEFLDYVNQGNVKGYCIGFNKILLGYPRGLSLSKISRDELYSFALSATSNSKMPQPIHDDLKYDIALLPFNPYVFKYKICYQQYYDILDVINEWLYSKDILTAFLKMYQIVEYIVYRKQMYHVVNVSSMKQSFLRSMKTTNKNFEDNERVSVIDGVKKLFPGIRPNVASISKAEVFIGEFFGKTKNHNLYLSTTTPAAEMDGAIARFIYDMRCSIVHNKEAEFHITYSNFDIYKDVIPLAKEVHDAMMTKIWDFLNTENNGIEYKKKQLDLY